MCVTLICGVVAVFLGQFIISTIGEITAILGIEVFVTKQVQEARRQKAMLKAEIKNKKGTSSIYSLETRGTSQSEETEKNKKKGSSVKKRADAGKLSE